MTGKYAMGVEKWLLSQGYKCFYNVPIKGKFPDILAIRNRQIIAVEIKKVTLEVPLAIGQCMFYKEGASKVYIALPPKEAELLTKATISVLKKNGIGLLKYSKSAAIFVEASDTGIRDSSLIDSLTKMQPGRHADIEKTILDVLESNNDIPINQIAKACNVNRITASKYLAVLEAKRLAQSRVIGKAKLYSVVK